MSTPSNASEPHFRPESSLSRSSTQNLESRKLLNSNDANAGAANQHPGFMPVAICGMACRLPGGIESPQQLWKFLLDKADARGPVPLTRYNVSAFHSLSNKPGSTVTEYGYFLDENIDIASLDTSFFSMSRQEVERVDPQQRQILEVARECIDDAGEVRWKGADIGVYVGSYGEEWIDMHAKETQQYGGYRPTGTGDFALSNRISYEMDLRGPSMTIRTGCSAALVGLNEACLAMSRGDCKSAIVGGTNLILAPGMTTMISEQGVLSKDASCKTFSADADGYARGEAIVAIFVKTLADAVREGNPIRAVIRGMATNSDGKTAGMTVPSTDAQEALIRRAYVVAGIPDIAKTAFFECHGTGTSKGDPIETEAVARTFGESGVYIGSVKPNLGHSEGASGLTSLLKAVLALEHRTIPPNIKFGLPNPRIPFESANLIVPRDATPWPSSRHERVSLNSFGIGGSNAHVILETPANVVQRESGVKHGGMGNRDQLQLLVFSANTSESLRRMVEAYDSFITHSPDKVADVAYTLAVRREHLLYRTYTVARCGNIKAVPPMVKSGQPPDIVMAFSGQGAHWYRMGRDLLRSNSVFQNTIRALDQYLNKRAEMARTWTIEDELCKPPKKSRLHEAEVSQPICTALQIALVDALAEIGVQPAAVVGHSSGEIAAAYASGAITAEAAIVIAQLRGKVMKQAPFGAMAAISMSKQETECYLSPDVVIACENSPRSITISGDATGVKNVVEAIKRARPDVLTTLLPVDKAYHSHHMIVVGEQYRQWLAKANVDARPTQKPMFSSVTGALLTEESLGPIYWWRNLTSPVLFDQAVTSLLEVSVGQHPLFLEIGPHSTLAGPIRQILDKTSRVAPYVSIMRRQDNSFETFLSALGMLHTHNASIDLKCLFSVGRCVPDLPRYPWDHSQHFWHETRVMREWRLRVHPHHELLGLRVAESTDFNPVWRNLFHADNAAWVRDHKINNDTVFPFAAYVAMAGEAVRQISGIQDGFRLRRIMVSTALIIVDGSPTELISSFRRQRLRDTLDSEWWDFTIESHNGRTWTKHCTGQVMASTDALAAPTISGSSVPRRVASRKWYESLRREGLNYGPLFQVLDDIHSTTTSPLLASASVRARWLDEPSYHINPSILDGALQLLGCAATNGLTRKFHRVVPTRIDWVAISRCTNNLKVTAIGRFDSSGVLTGAAEGVSSEGIGFRISGAHLSPLEENAGAINGHNRQVTACSQWSPHIDFLSTKALIKSTADHSSYAHRLNELTQLCLIYSHQSLTAMHLETKEPHLQRFLSWIKKQAPRSTASSIGPPVDLATVSGRIKDLVHTLKATEGSPVAVALSQVFAHMTDLFMGRSHALEFLHQDHILENLYKFMDRCDRTGFLQALAHSRPSLRVIEIGAGTGATTSSILNGLTRDDGHVLYSKYTFSDISAGFFEAAKKRFKNVQNMDFVVLDIGRDPVEQGFQEGQYDLVVATNVIHATPHLQASLKHVRKLLSPSGRLLLQELCPEGKWINYICGGLPGWWSHSDDGRADEPYVSPDRWKTELLAAGFKEPDEVVLDAPPPHYINAIMVASPQMTVEVESSKPIALLCASKTGNTQPVLYELEQAGLSVRVYVVGETLPPGRDVISIVDNDSPFLKEMTSTTWEWFKQFIQRLGDANLLWITRPSQMHRVSPDHAQFIGLARAIRSEMSAKLTTCEMEETASVKHITQVYHHLQNCCKDDSFDQEYEYAIYHDTVHVSRIYPLAISGQQMFAHETEDRAVLATTRLGRLESLQWVQDIRSTPQADEVEVEIHVASLNFRDVLLAMNLIQSDSPSLVIDAAGIVTRTGPNVRTLKAGDRVMLANPVAFATQITLNELYCVALPDCLSFVEASTMPIAYTTAIYSLINVGRLQQGQSILIHSASGGVGIAAIHVARMLNADIFVTVGNEEKVKFLMTQFQIPRNRIFHSRTDSFVEDIMRETDGKGIDLVLNSLSGELLHATWRCIAEFGTMVEIGKRDLVGLGRLDMDVFLANRTYTCVNIDKVRLDKPQLFHELLCSTTDLLRQKQIAPIHVDKLFRAETIQAAFRYMQQGQHIGKIVVEIRDNAGDFLMADPLNTIKAPRFDGSASYILVGGLGGLGRSISVWMVENGARSIVYLSPSAGNATRHEDFRREIESMGCTAHMVPGSVTSAEDVVQAIAAAPFPIRGVLQMSMVLNDQAFVQMPIASWNQTVDPKVEGTWNLHDITLAQGLELDFFISFSSLSGIIGNPGQANYASANTFLDAFTQYRRELGLPASTIDIGAVEDVGYLSEDTALLNKTQMFGFQTIRENDLLRAVAVAITDGQIRPGHTWASQRYNGNLILGLSPAAQKHGPTGARGPWTRDIRLAAYRNGGTVGVEAEATAETLKSTLNDIESDPTILTHPRIAVSLSKEIAMRLNSLLLKSEDDVDTKKSLIDLGMDSLIAIEMRIWWKQSFGVDISVLTLLSMGSVDALGQHAIDGLRERFLKG